MRWLRRLALLVGVFLAGLLLLWFVVMHTVCRNELTQKARSPSGRYSAEVLQSWCTVGSQMDTFVTIRTRPFFLSYPRLGNAAEIAYYNGLASGLRVSWNGDGELVIECLRCDESRVKLYHQQWRGISIRWTLQPAPPVQPQTPR
jgi:hypothetical protein